MLGVWMRRTRLLCAIGVSLWAAVVAGNQTAPPVALSGALRAHVKDERFGIVTSIRGLPLGVRDGLQRLFGSQTLDIAEPGAEFQVTDVILNPKLPIRRLVAAGCSTDHCLVYYERGGIVHTWQVALFHWTPAATRLGRYRARRPDDNRPRSERHPVRSDQELGQVLVVHHAYILWTAETADNIYEMGTDTFVVREGKIVAQSYAGKITPKG